MTKLWWRFAAHFEIDQLAQFNFAPGQNEAATYGSVTSALVLKERLPNEPEVTLTAVRIFFLSYVSVDFSQILQRTSTEHDPNR
jgi:hypothetical protein